MGICRNRWFDRLTTNEGEAYPQFVLRLSEDLHYTELSFRTPNPPGCSNPYLPQHGGHRLPPLVSEQIEIPDDHEAVQSLYLERGWSDGLPIVPPTPQRVEAMLAATNLPPDHVIPRFLPTGAQPRWKNWPSMP